MARGNAKSLMFLDADDYRKFLEILTEVAARFSIAVFAYCLMPNHYHLVARTCEPNVSVAIRYLNGVYAQWWNRRHGRCGHVTQGRFKAQLVQNEVYLWVVCRYVMNNPVRAGLVQLAQAWEWSSAGALTGTATPPAFLDTSIGRQALSCMQFDPTAADCSDTSAALQAFHFVERAIKEDARFLADDVSLRTFRDLVQRARDAGIARREWTGIRPTLAELFAFAGNRRARNRQIVEAREGWGFTQREIAEFLGVHVESVGRAIRSVRHRPAESSDKA
jgi:REP element-mobilizing transposase RayT